MGSLVTDDELSLRWNDFESSLAQSFSDMRDNSHFFDVKIACFDKKSVMKTIPAHKIILSACSPVFKELLCAIGTGDSNNPLLFLRGISYQEISAVLDFIYNGQTKVQHKELDAFLTTAEELKIKGLSKEKNSICSTPSRKRPFQQQPKDTYETNGGLKSNTKKSRPLSPIVWEQLHEDNFDNITLKSKIRNCSPIDQDGLSTSVPEDNSENITVTAEVLTLEVGDVDYEDFTDTKDENHEDYTKTEMRDLFDESNYQHNDEAGMKSLPADSKGLTFILI